MLNPDFKDMLSCLKDLLTNKVAAGRDKGQGDIIWLKRISSHRSIDKTNHLLIMRP